MLNYTREFHAFQAVIEIISCLNIMTYVVLCKILKAVYSGLGNYAKLRFFTGDWK